MFYYDFDFEANDCFYIGSFAHKQNDSYHTFSWLNAGYVLWKLDNDKNKIEIKNQLEMLINAALMVNFVLLKFFNI